MPDAGSSPSPSSPSVRTCRRRPHTPSDSARCSSSPTGDLRPMPLSPPPSPNVSVAYKSHGSARIRRCRAGTAYGTVYPHRP
jgi:hypothetical protein